MQIITTIVVITYIINFFINYPKTINQWVYFVIQTFCVYFCIICSLILGT